MRINDKDAVFDTVHCIAASPLVLEYMVGYTRRPRQARLAEYWAQHGYQHLVVLANGLSLVEGRDLEKYLQLSIWDADRGLAIFNKYNPIRRDAGRHIASIGPMPANGVEGHTVYMAWKDNLAYE